MLYFDAGGGHRAAAAALRATIEKRGLPFEIQSVNVQELLDEIDICRKITGLRIQDIYNRLLKKGWTIGAAQLLKAVQLAIRVYRNPTLRVFEALWRVNRPDMAISLIPNFNRRIYESLHNALPGVPMVTIMTDLADFPPHFWIEPQDQYMICGTDHAVAQAVAMGLATSKVFRVSGMILNPRFFEMAPLSDEERARRRAELGFNPDQPVGLVLFGGQGAAAMAGIAHELKDHQLILICGRNEALAARLRSTAHAAPILVEGFTEDVPRYMRLADYFIGKPGPASISEAIAMHLPVIVERNAWTLPQERYNAEWIVEQGVGIALPHFRGIAHAVDRLLEPAAYARYRAATEALNNHAVFEIADILERILAESSQEITPLRTA